jgi:hypothetical protein
MTMIYFAPKQSQNGVLCLFTSKFQTSTIGYYMGKRKIEDGKVYFLYPRAEDSLIAVWFPLELAIVYSRAVVKDKEVMKPFEDEIRTLARKEKNKVDLPEALVKRMMTESKKVLDSTPLSPSQ